MAGRVINTLRSGASGFLVVLTAIAFLAAGLGFWLNRNTLETEVWLKRVGPLASDPAIEQALTDYTTAQTMELVDVERALEEVLPDQGQILIGPITAAVEDFVREQVNAFFASDRFDELWRELNERAHQAVVRLLRDEEELESVEVVDGKVTLDLLPLIDQVLARIGEQSPELLGREVDLPTITVDDVPEDARARLGEALGVDVDEDFGTVTVFDSEKLGAAQDAVRIFDALLIPMAVLTVVLAALALLVARIRRRTALYLCFAVALDLVLIRRVTFTVQDEVGGVVRNPSNEAAAKAVVDAFLQPLQENTLLILWIVIAVAGLLFLIGPSRPAVAVRRWAGRLGTAAGAAVRGSARDERVTDWVTEHLTALQLGGVVVALVLMLWLELSWIGLLILLLLVGVWEIAVGRIAGPHDSAGDAPAS